MKRGEETSDFIETEFVNFAEYRVLGWNDFSINGWVIEQRDLSEVIIGSESGEFLFTSFVKSFDHHFALSWGN